MGGGQQHVTSPDVDEILREIHAGDGNTPASTPVKADSGLDAAAPTGTSMHREVTAESQAMSEDYDIEGLDDSDSDDLLSDDDGVDEEELWQGWACEVCMNVILLIPPCT